MLEKEAIRVKAEPEIIKTEVETLKEFERKASRTSRLLYLRLLERGASGATINQMLSDMEFEAVSMPVLKAPPGTLMKEGLVSEAGMGRYAVASALKNVGRKTYDVLVKKIYLGVAVVRVNSLVLRMIACNCSSVSSPLSELLTIYSSENQKQKYQCNKAAFFIFFLLSKNLMGVSSFHRVR